MFHGRYFSEENTENMYTVFVSGVVYYAGEPSPAADESLVFLPPCPACLEKLDVSVSGVCASFICEAIPQSEPKAVKWANLKKECPLCSI